MIPIIILLSKIVASESAFFVPFNARYWLLNYKNMANYVDIDQHKKILGTLYVVFSSLNIVLVLMFTAIASTFIPFHVHEQEALLAIRIVKYALITLTLVLTKSWAHLPKFWSS